MYFIIVTSSSLFLLLTLFGDNFSAIRTTYIYLAFSLDTGMAALTMRSVLVPTTLVALATGRNYLNLSQKRNEVSLEIW